MSTQIKLAPVTQLAAAKPDQIMIKGLVVDANIGIFKREKLAPQSISIDVILDVEPLGPEQDHSGDNIVRYDHIITEITELLESGHVDLVETLAENIAARCLDYARVSQADISVMKLDAFSNADGVGVRIVRRSA